MRLVLCSNVQQNGHIIIDCCSKLLVWQRRKIIFVSLQQFRRFYSLSSITLALTKPVFYFGRRRWNPHPLILQANRSTVLPRCFPLDIYISFAPSTDQRASLHVGQQAMQSVINRSTRHIVRLSCRRKPSKRSKTRAHSGPDAIRAFGRAHPSPMSARLPLQSSQLSTCKYIIVNQKK